MPPTKATDFIAITDPGKQLVDPTQFYQAMQLLLGYQNVTGVPNAQAPGPLLSMATNLVTVPAGSGTGPFNAQMPVGLAGLRLVIINLCSGALIINPSYNMALGRFDQIVGGPSIPSGNVYSAICYQTGSWYIAPVATGLPSDDPVIIPPDDETTPPEEC